MAQDKVDALFSILETVSGLKKEELIDGALNPEKQPELLRKAHERIREEARKPIGLPDRFAPFKP